MLLSSLIKETYHALYFLLQKRSSEELTKDGFILKHKGFYTSEQLKRIETGISNYDEIKENFIDLDEYSENR